MKLSNTAFMPNVPASELSGPSFDYFYGVLNNYKKSLTPPSISATLQSVDALHFKVLNFKALNQK